VADTAAVNVISNDLTPQAHEDDAERAVRAGLELVAAVSDLKTHAALQTRVGIATGLV
jgi:class 3 adenylate cyclase